ncbi:MAG: flagellar biosynthetic protein FliR, partial [Catonella sp.]
ANMVNVIVDFLGNYFLIAMRLMLPIYATMLLVNVVLGVMAKVAPQMNMFVVGIQLKLLGGLIVMVLMMTILPGVADYLIREMQDVFLKAVEALKS